jgi:antitoxin component YwqK of YwqJK toxin-antitoxin module
VVKTYWANGERRQEWHFENGVRSGTYQGWYEDGRLREEGAYDERGKQTGEWRRYNEDGSLNEKRSRTYGDAGGR